MGEICLFIDIPIVLKFCLGKRLAGFPHFLDEIGVEFWEDIEEKVVIVI
jgi:hypothetical protein